MVKISDSDDIEARFETFWDEEKKKAADTLCKEEGLHADKLQEVISNYLYTEREPMRDEIVEILETKPKIRERKTIVERVTNKLMEFIDTFMNDIG